MLISITTVEFSFTNPLILRVEFGRSLAQRRLSKSLTLDGGCVVDDYGYHAADVNLSFVVQKMTLDESVQLRVLAEFPSLLCLSCMDGVFTGYFQNVNPMQKGGINFMVLEKISL